MVDRTALRVYAEGLPAGTVMPVPREWVLELLEDGTLTGDPSSVADRLLTADEVAERLHLSKLWSTEWLNACPSHATSAGRPSASLRQD